MQRGWSLRHSPKGPVELHNRLCGSCSVPPLGLEIASNHPLRYAWDSVHITIELLWVTFCSGVGGHSALSLGV